MSWDAFGLRRRVAFEKNFSSERTTVRTVGEGVALFDERTHRIHDPARVGSHRDVLIDFEPDERVVGPVYSDIFRHGRDHSVAARSHSVEAIR